MAVLTPEVEAAVIRLHAALDPEEIILFGSRAYGTPRPDSDIDLLLVLRTAAEPLEARERRAREALGLAGWRRVDGHVWTYTPEELRRQLHRGSTTVRDDLAKGTRLFPAAGRRRYADLFEEWSATGAEEMLMEKAREDLILADKALTPPIVAWGAAFHAQRAAEKALKALVYHLGGEPDRTHSLSDLALKASELDPIRGRRILLTYQPRLADLAKHAVQPRCTEVPPVSEAEARAAVATARDVLADIMTIADARSAG